MRCGRRQGNLQYGLAAVAKTMPLDRIAAFAWVRVTWD
ncbi:hypothetical protein CFter6_5049 [Collimonas fungivorans]|uniref:Uncharacterized protein n=1 Tax=Collimonas fungivorans TaxID=158899 RepID=A0A127PIH8_9BURK|nr:hypothetical protein CFter6_5049 [Collimonas fungivorans]